MSFLGGWISGGVDQDANTDSRRQTRSQTAANNLNLPTGQPVGVGRGRSRSPSPLPVGQPHNANSAILFSFDSTNLSQRALQQQEQQPRLQAENCEEEEDFPRPHHSNSQVAMTSPQSTEELRLSAAAAVDAANSATAALQAATQFITGLQQQQETLQQLVAQQQQQLQQQSQAKTRKPELPDFDAKNVEIWIRRMTAAYERAGIILAKDKFAYLETKFRVGANPKIDEFLYGPANDTAWNSFLSYLRTEYGRTVRQEAQFLRSQHRRDGRRPSQMLAQLKDKVKRVTVDDILKDIIISSLPGDVQRMMAERVTELTAEQAAVLADSYFDQEGKPLHSTSNSPINNVDSAPTQNNAPEEVDDDADINAINGRRGNFRSGGRGRYNNNNNNNNNNTQFSRPFSDNGFNNNASGPPNRMGVKHRSHPSGASFNASSNSSSTSFNASAAKTPHLCHAHDKFGDAAYSCHPSCSRWPEMQRKQGNGQAGNRK